MNHAMNFVSQNLVNWCNFKQSGNDLHIHVRLLQLLQLDRTHIKCDFLFMSKHTVVKMCYISSYVSEQFQTTKVTFNLTQGYWFLCHSISHM